MNRFDAGAMRTPSGWIGFYRAVHRSENFVLRDGPHDIIFATEAEAKEAALGAFLDYLNSPISGISSAGAAAHDTADNLFVGLKPFIRSHGKERRVAVERKGAVA